MRRRAFTLIELLMVIGILMLLIGIAGYALSRVMGGSKVGATKVRLEALKSMVGEMEAATKGLNRPIAVMYDGMGGDYGTQQYWRDGKPNDTNAPPEPDPFPGPSGDLSLGSSGSGTPPRYNADAILNTQQIIGLLQQVPVAKSGLDKLQASEMMEALPAGLGAVRMTIRNPAGGTMPYNSGAANRAPYPPIPLDAWGNPIIFVPGCGLQVAVSGDGSGSGGTPKLLPTTVKGRDLRGFWASAGPDGAFNRLPGNDGTIGNADDVPAGDDNVYSFEN